MINCYILSDITITKLYRRKLGKKNIKKNGKKIKIRKIVFYS